MSSKMEVFLFAATLTPILTVGATNHDTDSSHNTDIPICDQNSRICCLPVVCGPGYEAIACAPSNTRAQCQPCPKEEYRNDISQWGFNDKCSKKKDCKGRHMMVEDEGGTTKDRQCTCNSSRVYDKETHTCRHSSSTKTLRKTTTSEHVTVYSPAKTTYPPKNGSNMQSIYFLGNLCITMICFVHVLKTLV